MCSNMPSGFLEVHQYCLVVAHSGTSMFQSNAVNNNAYDNYLQDLYCMKTFGCEYTVYMERIID